MDWNNVEGVEIFPGIVAWIKTRFLLLQDDRTKLEKNIKM